MADLVGSVPTDPEIEFVELLHRCDRPSTEGWPSADRRFQVMAKWRCRECGQRWQYQADVGYRLYWERVGLPSRKWRQREGRRLLAAASREDRT